MRRAAKVDANHAAVVEALRDVGATVRSTAQLGDDFVDAVCGFRGITYLVEIKNRQTSYGKRGMTHGQRTFAETWRGGPVIEVDGPEDALRKIGALE